MKPEQITAWALDETSAEERQQLEAALLDNPQTKQTAEETKEFCNFLLTELRDDSLALTDAQRDRLKAQTVGQSSRLLPAIGTPAGHFKWRTGAVRFAIAACVVLGAFWTWSQFDASQTAREVVHVDDVEHQVQFKKQNITPLSRQPESAARPLLEVAQKAMVVDESLERAAGKGLASLPAASPAPEGMPRLLAPKDVASRVTEGDLVELKKMQDQAAYDLSFVRNMGSLAESPLAGKPSSEVTFGGVAAHEKSASMPSSLVLTGDLAGGAGVQKSGAGTLVVNGTNTYTGGATSSGGIILGAPAPVPGARPVTKFDTVTLRGGQLAEPFGDNSRVLVGEAKPADLTVTAGTMLSVTTTPASPPVVMNPQPDAYYFAYNEGRESSEELKRKQIEEGEKMRASWQLQKDARSNTESYTRILENELKDVAREPLSTFSIDVDTAAYANVRRFLNQNTIPPADAVRIEELVNYFPTAEEGPAHDAKEPFAVRVEMAPCPWQPVHRLARIAIKGRELGDERKNSNLVFLVDVSGSMNEPNKLPLVQQSLRMLTEQLGEGDKVTMVVYAGSSGLVLPPTNGEKRNEILAAIDKLKAGGSTHGSAGIQLAYEQAVAGFINEGVNRVILCTDGDFNVGVSSPEELEKLITKKAKSGVFLSVLGFGSGNLKDRTMETLADKGNGNYAYIDSLSEARKVLVEQMSGTLVTIAKDVKIQVEFNPAAVRSYRLIGYENRMLAKEDFNDDTKDAGEIGAGHSVVALYEVVPANLPPGTEPRPAVDSLKYQAPALAPERLAEAAKSGEMMTVKLRYKEPDSDLSKLIEMPVKDEGKTLTASSEEYKFSAAVAGFGLLLRDSAYKGALSWETVRRLALDGKGADKLGYRGEFLQLIDKARGLKETRP